MTTALEQLKEDFLTEDELANFFGVDAKRIRDLRSYHMNGKHRFIECIKPTSKCVLYRLKDIKEYLHSLQEKDSFGIALKDLD